jgi:hypothetical protein
MEKEKALCNKNCRKGTPHQNLKRFARIDEPTNKEKPFISSFDKPNAAANRHKIEMLGKCLAASPGPSAQGVQVSPSLGAWQVDSVSAHAMTHRLQWFTAERATAASPIAAGHRRMSPHCGTRTAPSCENPRESGGQKVARGRSGAPRVSHTYVPTRSTCSTAPATQGAGFYGRGTTAPF